jgi:hypothetical protein
MEPIPSLSKPARELLVEISRCFKAQTCLAAEDPRHACSEIVTLQWSHRTPAERLDRWRDEHHMPEPWYGHLERAPILFLSSNPSISIPPSVFPNPLPPYSRQGHPLLSRLGRAPTMAWEDDALERWYEDAFDFRVAGGNKGLKADGMPKPHTQYWSWAKNRAEELIPNRGVRPGIDYALTEVVHCKSQEEEGVGDAAKVCADRYLSRVLDASAATVIIVVGKPAKKAITSRMPFPPPDPRLVGPVRLGSRERYFAFIAHPSSSLPKTLATCLRPDEVTQLREVVAAADQSGIAQPRTNKSEAGAPESQPALDLPKSGEPIQRKSTVGLSTLLLVLAVACFGYWIYSKSPTNRGNLLAPVSQPGPAHSADKPNMVKCSKCGAPLKLGNNYCTTCGAKAEVSK